MVGLNNTSDPNSGNQIVNTQRLQNELADATGVTGEGDTGRKDYSSNNVVANGDNRKVAVGKLDAKFNNVTGHAHTGAAGDGGPVSALDLADNNAYYAVRQTFTVTGASGADDDVTTQLTGFTPGGGVSAVGVVTSPPYNKCDIRDSSTDTYIEDAGGQRVYGRITESSGTWTLTYYTNEAGVETAHTLATTDIRVFFNQVFDSATRPTFGEDAGYLGSFDVTADVVDASPSQSGKVNTASQSFGGIKTFGDGVSVDGQMARPRHDQASAATLNAMAYYPFVKLTGTTATTLNGITPGGDGKSIIIHNGTNQLLTVAHEAGSASASDRIKLPNAAPVIVFPDQTIELIYDANQSRWVQKSGSGSGSGSGGGLNLLTLDSNWSATKSTNANAETTVGDWEAYNDGASNGIIAQDLSAYDTAFGVNGVLDQIAQKFTAAISGNSDEVTFQINNPGAAMVGNIVCKIFDDAAGSPGTLLATSDNYDASTIPASPADVLFNFTTPAALASGIVYHAVLDFSGVTFTGNFNVVANTGNPYAGGNAESSNDGGSTFSPFSGTDLYFKVESTTATSALDLTGGTSGLTLSRTTTVGEVLDGSASFKVVKPAADSQNNGVSCHAYIPLGYRGQRLSFKFPYKIISGSLVAGDVQVVAYDITNSQLLYPSNINLPGSQGILKGTLDVPATCEEIRFGLNFATSSASALSFAFDDVSLSTEDVVIAGTMSDWVDDDSLTFDNMGTITNYSVKSRYVGDMKQYRGNIMLGTCAAAQAAIDLGGLQIDFSKLPTSTTGHVFGLAHQVDSSGSRAHWINNGSGDNSQIVIGTDGSQAGKALFAWRNISSVMGFGEIGTSLFQDSTQLDFFFEIPVVGKTSNAVVTNAQMFKISDYLATGTRVTGTAPTKLGEYRSYLRIANTATYTETSGDPADAPSVADGIKIYGGVNYTAGDNANGPSKYEIFIGKNKKFQTQFYGGTGRTLYASNDVIYYAPNSTGTIIAYDPNTGILVAAIGAYTGVNYPAVDETGGAITDAYFDVFVSESVVPVQSVGTHPVIKTYTADDTYTPSEGIAYARLKFCGGGGAGGNGTASGGGGSGAYVEHIWRTPNSQLSIVMGLGGASPTAAGSDTILSGPVNITAGGGGGGSTAGGAPASAAGGAGGVVTGADADTVVALTGQSGGTGFGTSGVGYMGYGGSTPYFGGGGANGSYPSTGPGAGTSPGAGGGGGYLAGAVGADGIVIIEEYYYN